MEMLFSLWMPILVSAVAVFIAAFLAWMVLPHHRSDWSKLPDDKAFVEALRSLGLPPGQYMFPYAAEGAEMKSPEFKERLHPLTPIPPRLTIQGATKESRLERAPLHAIAVSRNGPLSRGPEALA